MTDCEILIELLKQKQDCGHKIGTCQMDESHISNEEIANFLVENGVMISPIKIGTTVWTNEPFNDGVIRDGGVVAMMYSKGGVDEIYVDFSPEPLTAVYYVEDIGKKIFLFKEEAEKAKESQANIKQLYVECNTGRDDNVHKMES